MMRTLLALFLALAPLSARAQQLPATQPQPDAWSSHQNWRVQQDMQIQSQQTQQLQMQQRQIQQQQIQQQTQPTIR